MLKSDEEIKLCNPCSLLIMLRVFYAIELLALKTQIAKLSGEEFSNRVLLASVEYIAKAIYISTSRLQIHKSSITRTNLLCVGIQCSTSRKTPSIFPVHKAVSQLIMYNLIYMQ